MVCVFLMVCVVFGGVILFVCSCVRNVLLVEFVLVVLVKLSVVRFKVVVVKVVLIMEVVKW